MATYKPKTLEEVIRWVDGFEFATREARFLAERDRDYYDNRQWTPEEVAELRLRKQPILTVNRIAPKIDYMMGYERRSRSDPKAFPRTKKEEGASDAATDSIRFVCDQSDWPQERSYAFKNFAIEGACGASVVVESDGGEEIDIVIEHIPWDRLIWDYRSRRPDYKDAKWKGEIAWFDLDDAIEMFEPFKGSEEVLNDSINRNLGQSNDVTFQDRPTYTIWTDTRENRPRVKVAMLYYRTGGKRGAWSYCVFTRAGFLIPPQPSPYLSTKGIPTCPIEIQSAKEDRDNQRYGVVRPLISPQDEINHRRSKALHILNTRQTMGDKNAVDDINQAKRESQKPDGHIAINPGSRFEFVPNADLIAGQLNLLAEAKGEIDAIGANAALSGKNEGDASGRAIQARQQGGTLELEPIYDGFRAWQLRVYRAVWERIKQFWTAEKWVRVTDNEDNLRYVGLNKPLTVGEIMQKQGHQLPDISQLPQQQQQQIQQELNRVVDTENDIAQLDVDIILDEGTDVVTIQQEQFDMLTRIPQMPPDLLIEASSLRNKREILERLRSGGATPEQQQAAAQQQQQVQQMAIAGATLDIQQKQADVEHTKAETAEIGVKIGRGVHESMLNEVRQKEEQRHNARQFHQSQQKSSQNSASK